MGRSKIRRLSTAQIPNIFMLVVDRERCRSYLLDYQKATTVGSCIHTDYFGMSTKHTREKEKLRTHCHAERM